MDFSWNGGEDSSVELSQGSVKINSVISACLQQEHPCFRTQSLHHDEQLFLPLQALSQDKIRRSQQGPTGLDLRPLTSDTSHFKLTRWRVIDKF